MLLVSYVPTKCGKDTLKEFQEVSEVLNTSLNMKIWSFLETAILFVSLAAALLWSLILLRTSRGSGCILALCLCVRFHDSLQVLSFSLSSQFFFTL